MHHTPLNHLTDEEFLRHAHQAHDSLTTTDVEIEFMQRFENLLQRDDEITPLREAIDKSELAFDDVETVFDTLAEFNVTTPDELRQKLERADKFYDIANDSGDVFSRLNDLVNTTR